MALSIDYDGWVVLVTGGGRGVGVGIVERFLEAGAHVEFCGRNEPADIPQFAGRAAHFTAVDVRDPDQVEAWVQDVAARHGRIDVVVNNAGGSPFGRFVDGSPRYLRAITELNFLSVAFMARAVYPVFARQENGGSLINISSLSGQRQSPGTAVYGAAKAAVESLTASLAAEWAPHIRVNAVRCGMVETEGAAGHYGDEEGYAKVAQTIPRGRLAQPAEIGAACVMLASPLSSHITGAVLAVDGGGEWPAFLAYTPHADTVLRPEGVTS